MQRIPVPMAVANTDKAITEATEKISRTLDVCGAQGLATNTQRLCIKGEGFVCGIFFPKSTPIKTWRRKCTGMVLIELFLSEDKSHTPGDCHQQVGSMAQIQTTRNWYQGIVLALRMWQLFLTIPEALLPQKVCFIKEEVK